MRRQAISKRVLAAVAVALALGATASAQTSPDAATATIIAPPRAAAPAGDSARSAPVDAPTSGPAAPASGTSPAGGSAPIGSTSLTRADSANIAYERLAPDRAFVSMSDLRDLTGFGDAFARADRDHDGRLDRTEFTDAWAYYVGTPVEPNAATATAAATR